jgi:hypothetical protein
MRAFRLRPPPQGGTRVTENAEVDEWFQAFRPSWHSDIVVVGKAGNPRSTISTDQKHSNTQYDLAIVKVLFARENL